VDEDERQVLFFGRIWAYKGLDTLIQAEPLISHRVPDVRIVIAGRGEDLVPYQARMVHPERFVIHNSFVPPAERERLFASSSVVVLPYVEATQSGVIPVAYTHAKPVVATRVGGLVEQVEHGRTGLLVPPGDPESLAEATTRLLLDRELRRALGENGRRKLEAEWSAPVIAARTLPAYRRAIDYHHLKGQN
jgi:glycosyltransferase involved in cell wall biosynthesis